MFGGAVEAPDEYYITVLMPLQILVPAAPSPPDGTTEKERIMKALYSQGFVGFVLQTYDKLPIIKQ